VVDSDTRKNCIKWICQSLIKNRGIHLEGKGESIYGRKDARNKIAVYGTNRCSSISVRMLKLQKCSKFDFTGATGEILQNYPH
jgi:hypothetical protein